MFAVEIWTETLGWAEWGRFTSRNAALRAVYNLPMWAQFRLLPVA